MPATLEPATATAQAAAVIVRIRGHAVLFHRNLCGHVYCVVPEDEATRFHSATEAHEVAAAHGLSPINYQLSTIN